MKRALSVPDIDLSLDNPESCAGGSGRAKRRNVTRKGKGTQQVLTAAATVNTSNVSAAMPVLVPSTGVGAIDISGRIPNVLEVEKLRHEVSVLKGTVTELQHKVEFLLSFLDLSDNRNDLLLAADRTTGVSNVTDIAWESHDSGGEQLPSQARGSGGSTQPVGGSGGGCAGKPLYSQAAKVGLKLRGEMRNELLSAVHIELGLKNQRANNVVVNGMPEVLGSGGADIDHVRDLINVEFGNQTGVNVVSCKRLGVQSKDKVRPLLVTMVSNEHAKYLIDNAKRLRLSHCDYTKHYIFLNSFMTKAESKAAYELRCKRRSNRTNKGGLPAAGAGATNGAGTAGVAGVDDGSSVGDAGPGSGFVLTPVDSDLNASDGRQSQQKSAAATDYVAVGQCVAT